MTLRVYLRRSKADAGHQEHSLDTQLAGVKTFVAEDDRLRGLSWDDREVYTADGVSGDDTAAMVALDRLVADLRPGDVVVTRDHSRIGRHMLESAAKVVDITASKARLFYYESREQITAENANQMISVVLRGYAGHAELEANRGRVREGLRARVAQGRPAGCPGYGYTTHRLTDESGRSYSIVKIVPEQAKIVQRIWREYADGHGCKPIARRLNDDGVPSPRAGRRGTGSWSPSQVREMVHRERYVGLNVHGVIKKSRKGGKYVHEDAPESEVMRVEVPEWRIIDDETARRVRARLGDAPKSNHQSERRVAHTLSTIARCATCGGPIGALRRKIGKESVKVYGCIYNHQRGRKICSVTCAMPLSEVEANLAKLVVDAFTDPRVIALVVVEVRRLLAPKAAPNVAKLEHELSQVKAEQGRLASAIASGGEIPVLLGELRARASRQREIEGILKTVRAPAAQLDDAKLAKLVKAKLADMAGVLARQPARDFYRSLFPKGLPLTPRQEGRRQVWDVDAVARVLLPIPVATPEGVAGYWIPIRGTLSGRRAVTR